MIKHHGFIKREIIIVDNITVAILDDDILARNTIKQLLEESRYEIVKEFQDPERFLEWIKENDVNILLCDMRMPKLNGLELIERVRVTHKYLSIIAISSFDDFDFARGCLLYGVEDYLLKSTLDRKQLLKVLDRVSEKNQIISKQQTNSSNCYQVDETITKASLEIRSNIAFNVKSVSPIVFTLNYPILESSNYNSYRTENYKALIDIINQVLSNNYPYVIQKEDDNLVSVYLSFDKTTNIPSLINRIEKSFVDKIMRKTKRLLDLSLIVVQSNNTSFDIAYENRHERINKMRERLYLVDNGDIFVEDEKVSEIEGYVFKEHCLNILNFSLETAYEELASNVLEFIFNEMLSKRVSKSRLLMVARKLLKNIDIENDDIINQIDNIYIFKVFIKNKYLIVLRKKSGIIKEKYSPSIYQLMLYIQKNYKADYSLGEYAEKMNVSYTHLSRMFKKETGLGFAEYANQIKVNQAKLLLIDGNNSIKYISEATGFKGYNYFFRVFKDIEGVPPIEYIAKNCSN